MRSIKKCPCGHCPVLLPVRCTSTIRGSAGPVVSATEMCAPPRQPSTALHTASPFHKAVGGKPAKQIAWFTEIKTVCNCTPYLAHHELHTRILTCVVQPRLKKIHVLLCMDQFSSLLVISMYFQWTLAGEKMPHYGSGQAPGKGSKKILMGK